jgi:hypothetical protein
VGLLTRFVLGPCALAASGGAGDDCSRRGSRRGIDQGDRGGSNGVDVRRHSIPMYKKSNGCKKCNGQKKVTDVLVGE